ncbi:hypothetical protein QA612_20605 [Evansella sp. AB-P1]|uniref:hypothetical protein n=1 Tax=Evansella sp. AB-P1 TaxID=3037653 RepID=UPI00241E4EF1|nr:hypothetical protein [Evansella sp. AB-P1]MDG5789861.1 hypothetical protein [Evansella sp. AB-P1]
MITDNFDNRVAIIIYSIGLINIILGILLSIILLFNSPIFGITFGLSAFVSGILLIGFAYIIEYIERLIQQSEIQVRTQTMLRTDMEKMNKNLEAYLQYSTSNSKEESSLEVSREEDTTNKNNVLSTLEVDDTKEVPLIALGDIYRYFDQKYNQKPTEVKGTTYTDYYVVCIGANLKKIIKVEDKRIIELL